MALPELPVSVWEFLEYIKERGYQLRDCDVEDRFRNALSIALNHRPPLIENDLSTNDSRVGYNGIKAVESGTPEAQDLIAAHLARQNGTYSWSLTSDGKFFVAMREELPPEYSRPRSPSQWRQILSEDNHLISETKWKRLIKNGDIRKSPDSSTKSVQIDLRDLRRLAPNYDDSQDYGTGFNRL